MRGHELWGHDVMMNVDHAPLGLIDAALGLIGAALGLRAQIASQKRSRSERAETSEQLPARDFGLQKPGVFIRG
jgi:hypothetical protein